MFFIALIFVVAGGAAYYYLKRRQMGRPISREELKDFTDRMVDASRVFVKTVFASGTKTASVSNGIAAKSKTGMKTDHAALENHRVNEQLHDVEETSAERFYREWEEVYPDEDEWEEVVAPRAGIEKSPADTLSVNNDRCCICGKKLGEDATKLAGLPFGREMYIDKSCHKILGIMAATDDPSAFIDAYESLKIYIDRVDPELAQALAHFIHKGQTRLNLK